MSERRGCDDRPELAFAFPDGALDYVCRECDAPCCRGQGISGNLRREMGALLADRPGLSSLVIARRGDVVSIANPPDACFFLEDDLRCGVESRGGRASKPGMCRLFPFSRMTRVGATLFLAPDFYCPLRVVTPARPGEVEGSHRRVAACFAEVDLWDAAPTALPLEGGETPDGVVAGELALVEACGRSLGGGAFHATLAGLGGAGDLASFVTRAGRLLGLDLDPAPRPHDALDDVFHVIAPALSLAWLPRTLARRRRALALGEAVVRQTGVRPMPKGVYGLVARLGPTLGLLAIGDEPPPSPPSLRVPRFADPRMTLAAALATRASARGLLDALTLGIEPAWTPAERAEFLAGMASALDASS